MAGHEISHGFDQIGRQFDEHGNLADWWTNATVNGFVEREKCFVDQYQRFTITAPNGTAVHVSGNTTEAENIADNGGVRVVLLLSR